MISKSYRIGDDPSWVPWAGVATTVAVFTAAIVILSLTADTASSAVRGVFVTHSGPEVRLGQGTARTYIETVDGVPTEIGVALTEAALRALPTNHDHHGSIAMPDGHRMFEYVLDLPENNPTSFRHVSLNWNPGGHEPPGIYDTPHFDFHFQFISDAERRTITPDHPGWANGEVHPNARYMPAGYEPIPPAVPLMGLHWIDPKTPELHGQPFTQTFIFGTWQGKLIFAEPMITKAFLESRPDFSAPLPVPQNLDARAYHPSRYRIRWDHGSREYRVSLTGLVTP